MAKLVEFLMEVIAGIEDGTRNPEEEGNWVTSTPAPNFHDLMDRVKKFAPTPAPTTPTVPTPEVQPKSVPISEAIAQWAEDMINSSSRPWSETKVKEYQALDTGAPKESPRKAIMKILKDRGVCTCSNEDIAKALHLHEHYISQCNWQGCPHDGRIVDSGDTWETSACTPVYMSNGTLIGIMNNSQRGTKHRLEKAIPTIATPEPLPFSI